MSPNVQKADGSAVPLEQWKLDGLSSLVSDLQAIVDEAVASEKSDPETAPCVVYEWFGTRAFPGVLSLLRQLPAFVEELRAFRKRDREYQPEAKGMYGKYVIFKRSFVDDQTVVVGDASLPSGGVKIPPEDALGLSDCFVLRPKKDRAARVALRIYARETMDGTLASDIHAWLNGLPT